MAEITDEETAEVLTALVRSPLIREMLKAQSPLMTDEIIDNLRIVPIGADEPEPEPLRIWREL